MPSHFDANNLLVGAGATFDPADLKVITTAFNEAWAEIQSKYPHVTGPSARSTLALAILAAASPATHRRNVEALKAAGLRAIVRT
jgi:hypothetical protein